MPTDAEVLAGFLLLALAAALTKAVTPRSKGWDSSRAATQRDVADVLAGRRRRDRRGDEAMVFAGILMLAALAKALIR